MTAYQESYGDGWDDYDRDAEEWLVSRVAPIAPPRLWYDYEKHEWHCRCEKYQEKGHCKHVYFFKGQEQVCICEEYRECL